MKQHIEIKQLKEISKEEIKILAKLTTVTEDYLYNCIYEYREEFVYKYIIKYLNIGKMIEILEENNKEQLQKVLTDYQLILEGDLEYNTLCDSLWKVIKEIL